MNEKFTNEMIIHVICVIRYFVELDDMNHTFSNSFKLINLLLVCPSNSNNYKHHVSSWDKTTEVFSF